MEDRQESLASRARAAIWEAGRALAVFVCSIAAGLILSGASPVASPAGLRATPSPSASATPSAAKPETPHLPDGQAVISYLSQAIGWYRHLAVEERFIDEPSELLFFADDREMAGEVLDLGFGYAHAQAQLLSKLPAPLAAPAPKPAAASTPGAASAAAPDLASLEARKQAAEQQEKLARQKLEALQHQLGSARGRKRRELLSKVAAARSEVDLSDARADALESIVAFEAANGLGGGHKSSGLLGQVEELERSVPQAERKGKAPANARAATPSARHAAEPTGIIGLAQSLLALHHKLGAIDQTVELTGLLSDAALKLRTPLIKDLNEIRRRGAELAAKSNAGDVEHLRRQQQEFQALVERHKLLSAAALPLTKQLVLLGLYTANLKRWRQAVERRSGLEFRNLMLRLTVLGVVLAMVFLGAVIWRRVTFRYVQDIRRRHQFLQARRLILALAVGLILLFNFASELGAVVTVMGFAAAGIALALQNVILSVAGYFFLIGKFGIKAGDRVQITGVTGDVIDIGLVKLSLMELSGQGNDHQPTGRVVVFSNAIVFQPNGNFFKQVPGTNFVWKEINLVLAGDCDYRMVEKRLLEAVEDVFTRYRESIHRQYREIEKTLNMTIEMPRPQSRLQLSPQGLQVTLRYPVETQSAVQTADEVTRRLLDAISREPTLRLVGQATPNIQPADETAATEADAFAAK